MDDVLLQTTRMDLQVNSENLGISGSAPTNTVDTIRSDNNQLYNYPDFRRFGYRICPKPSNLLVTSAYAQEDCPEQTEYISRMDNTKTQFSLDVDYNASSVGLGIIDAGTDLLQVVEIKETYLQDFENNAFLNGGAPSPLTINRNFFLPINGQWVTFHFLFFEIDNTEFPDSALAFIDIDF